MQEAVDGVGSGTLAGQPAWVTAIVALYMTVAGLLAELAELE